MGMMGMKKNGGKMGMMRGDDAQEKDGREKKGVSLQLKDKRKTEDHIKDPC
jgi:hypothetical protein